MSLLRPQLPGRSVPHPSLHSQAYWDGCRRGELLYQRCSECGYRGLRAFTICAQCHAASPVWERSNGLGSLYSWSVVWRPPDPSFHVPYAPAVVRLDEDVFVISAIVGCEPDALHDGMRLAVEFHPASDNITLPYFAPDSTGGKP